MYLSCLTHSDKKPNHFLTVFLDWVLQGIGSPDLLFSQTSRIVYFIAKT